MSPDPESLRAEFEALGIPAEEAKAMADKDATSKTPQLVRHTLLRAAWENVVDPGGRWVEAYSKSYPMNRPLAALVEAGVDRAKLTALVRTMQFDLLAAIAVLLDEGGAPSTSARWGLFELDEGGAPARRVLALHESVTAADPTGEADGWM